MTRGVLSENGLVCASAKGHLDIWERSKEGSAGDTKAVPVLVAKRRGFDKGVCGSKAVRASVKRV